MLIGEFFDLFIVVLVFIIYFSFIEINGTTNVCVIAFGLYLFGSHFTLAGGSGIVVGSTGLLFFFRV